ncbi:hypothetical protein PBI_LEMURIA_59 [Mycobacterium phage Lemuria]|uniref:Uncharacterized protein n=1 Tax=Mycobacterium phage Lemuria TaxID=2599868 RepID=A0A5J6THH7_9CAUD|nr:hypothetical protein KDW76_gp59 [Mycobacterium phage Lemuria]QFG10145.1 hypothetical protein PBI_LEMURIA_59 [Mycobacterium phage Lemuria]
MSRYVVALVRRSKPCRRTIPVVWFSFGAEDIAAELRGIRKQLAKVVRLMASFDQVRADYKAYATELKEQRDAAIAAAEAAAERDRASLAALEAFQADDAATDAAQLVAQRQADADALQSDLDDVKGRPEPVEPEVPATDPPVPAEPSTPFPSGPSGDTDPVIPPVETPASE